MATAIAQKMTRVRKVSMTEADRLEVGEKLSKAKLKLNAMRKELEESKGADKERWKSAQSSINAKDSEVTSLAEQIKTGLKEVQQEVKLVYDVGAKLALYVSIENDRDIVDKRAMSAEEIRTEQDKIAGEMAKKRGLANEKVDADDKAHAGKNGQSAGPIVNLREARANKVKAKSTSDASE